MRIHTNTLTISDVYAAARFARVDVVKLTEHGSRKRDHAFDINLEGESRRRPNGGSSGRRYGTGYAATWDQWGVFLSVLFDLDSDLSTPYYADQAEFHYRTNDRFLARQSVQGFTRSKSDNANVINVATSDGYLQHIADHYWPADAHGDHRFEFQGTAREQGCKKCSATMSWA